MSLQVANHFFVKDRIYRYHWVGSFSDLGCSHFPVCLGAPFLANPFYFMLKPTLVKLIETVDKHVGLVTKAGQKEADAKQYAAIKKAETAIEIRKMAMRAEIDFQQAERAIMRLAEDNL